MLAQSCRDALQTHSLHTSGVLRFEVVPSPVHHRLHLLLWCLLVLKSATRVQASTSIYTHNVYTQRFGLCCTVRMYGTHIQVLSRLPA